MADASSSLSCFIQYCLNFNLNFLELWIRIDFSVVLPLSAKVVDAYSVIAVELRLVRNARTPRLSALRLTETDYNVIRNFTQRLGRT